jgi:hypothetical protein
MMVLCNIKWRNAKMTGIGRRQGSADASPDQSCSAASQLDGWALPGRNVYKDKTVEDKFDNVKSTDSIHSTVTTRTTITNSSQCLSSKKSPSLE